MGCARTYLGLLTCSVSIAALAPIAEAALTLVPNANCSHVGNLVTNGSFEDITGGGPPGSSPANWRLWATGTTLSSPPFAVPIGWTSSGNANTYAVWGNDGPLTLRTSDQIPDGELAMYFGNGGMATVDLAPTFNPDGTVTFSGSPTITQPVTFSTPVTLSQTIPTSTSIAPSYGLSFWISGEGANLASDPTGNSLGIFGFRMTNVLPGDPIHYLAVPSASNNFMGKSKRYDFLFTPLNASQDVSIEFINYGHFDLTLHNRGGTTELVLDDVMINMVPEPSTAMLLLAGAWAVTRRRRSFRA